MQRPVLSSEFWIPCNQEVAW